MSTNRERADKTAISIPHDDYYDKTTITGRLQEIKIRNVKRLLGEISGQRLLEAGVGDGFFLERLTDAGELYGFDLSTLRVQRAAPKAPGAKLTVEDIHNLSYPDAFFDLVTCIDVLEHVSGPAQAVSELLRVTRPGGKIVLSVPNEINNIIGRFLLRKKPVVIDDHIHHLSPGKLSRYFGSRPARTANIPPLPFLLCTNFVGMWVKG